MDELIGRALAQAALDLHEAAGRFDCVGKLNAKGCRDAARTAARRADVALANARSAKVPKGREATLLDLLRRAEPLVCMIYNGGGSGTDLFELLTQMREALATSDLAED